jgi:hypothetical protein
MRPTKGNTRLADQEKTETAMSGPVEILVAWRHLSRAARSPAQFRTWTYIASLIFGRGRFSVSVGMKFFPKFLLLSGLLLVASVPIPAVAQAPDTNIEAVVRGLKDPQTQSAAVRRLGEMVTHWPGTNFAGFSSAVDG